MMVTWTLFNTEALPSVVHAYPDCDEGIFAHEGIDCLCQPVKSNRCQGPHVIGVLYTHQVQAE